MTVIVLLGEPETLAGVCHKVSVPGLQGEVAYHMVSGLGSQGFSLVLVRLLMEWTMV